MEIFIAIIMVAAGVVLVIKGGDWFVDAASWIAKALKVPTFIIGATIVSIATTLPEMIVSLSSVISEVSAGGTNIDTDMAIGNAVGSVTANTGLIMALAFLFLGAKTNRRQVLPQILMLIGSATFLFVGSTGGQLAVWGSVVLLVIFVIFMTYNVLSSKKMALSGQLEEEEPLVINRNKIIHNIGLFIVGAGAIVLGSNFLVDGATALAEAVGIDDRIIAITIVAIGTSLPELITTITAIRKKEANLSVGNVIGANIIDLTLIMPLCSLVSGQPLPVSFNCLWIDLPVCLGMVLLGTLPLLIKEKSYKWQAGLMLVLYTAYIVVSAIITVA